MKEDGLTPKEETPEETRKYFVAWLNQPIAKDLADKLVLIDDNGFEFKAVILGCKFVVTGGSEPNAIHIAGSLFAALEAFLATSLEDVQPYLENVNVVVEADDSLEQLITTIDRSSGELVVRVKYPKQYELAIPAQREAFRDWLIQSVAEIVSACSVTRDVARHIENPHAYKVIVGTNPLKEETEAGTLVVTTSRFNLMTPKDSKNLDLFLQQQRLAGSCGLVPVTPGSRRGPGASNGISYWKN